MNCLSDAIAVAFGSAIVKIWSEDLKPNPALRAAARVAFFVSSYQMASNVIQHSICIL